MREWLVSADYRGPSSITINPNALDELAIALSDDPDERVSVGGGRGWVRITHVKETDDAQEAWRPFLAAVPDAWARVVQVPMWQLVAMTLSDAAYAEEMLARSDRLPEIVGVAEAAEILGISAAAMANRVSRGTIKPDARISAGPLWARSTIERMIDGELPPYVPGSVR